jgi:hypothetical protein
LKRRLFAKLSSRWQVSRAIPVFFRAGCCKRPTPLV